MAYEFKLPDVGEGVVEGEIVRWLVKEGDVVSADQGLIEIMTDKATVVIPSPRAGRIAKTVGKEGEIILVGKTFVVIEEGNGSPAPAGRPAPAGGQKAAPAPALKTASAAGPPPKAAPPPAAAATAAAVTATAATSARDILATPATRRLARELEVDIARVTPTGPRGRITHDDVRRFAGGETAAAAAPPGAAPPPSATGAEERQPLRGLRKKIAEKMVQSKFTAPHYTYVEEVDVTDLVRLRSAAQKLAEEKGVKLTYLPYVIKALIAGLKRFPLVNATLDDAAGEIVLKRYYHIGIATSTEKGLMVPVVRDADRRSLLDLASEIDRLARGAREMSLAPHELSGSTFTITNLGPLGGVLATPIINHPEVAIMGIHKIRRRPVYEGEALVPRDLMNVSMSFDHRVVDGAIGAEFTQHVVRYLENPNLLFMEMV